MRDAFLSANLDRICVPADTDGVTVTLVEFGDEPYPALVIETPGVSARLELHPEEAQQIAQDLERVATEAIGECGDDR